MSGETIFFHLSSDPTPPHETKSGQLLISHRGHYLEENVEYTVLAV
jgi:hypothetical protein